MRGTGLKRIGIAAVACAAATGWLVARGPQDATPLDAESRGHVAGMAAHHLCSGVFVVGRDYRRTPAEVLEQDIRRFPAFKWQDDFEYDVDETAKLARVWGPGVEPRVARYNGDQGCTILPQGADNVFFEPVTLHRAPLTASARDWPMGDRGAHAMNPEGVDGPALATALDWAMAQEAQNTRALVVTHRGNIVGERYAPGFTKSTPQISWSQGKSITSALVGVMVRKGWITLDQPAPVAAWQGDGDPRRAIRIRQLLRMSSGLDFKNYGLDRLDSWTTANEHFRIYFDAINVFDHAVDQPLEIPPDSQFRYRNSDPLTLGRILREQVEQHGGEYLSFPQRELFDRIGARNFVLETDAWGNFIMTGYDYGSAWDWTRFGLLHLRGGVWENERILPEGWVEFISTPAPGDPGKGYGGLFWLNRGGALSRVPEDAFWASGFMGQTTMVIPSRDLVIVRLGPSPGGFSEYLNEAVGRILDALGGAVPSASRPAR